MIPITIAGKNYFGALELSEEFPTFFLGCKTRYVRRIIEKKNIPVESYIYSFQKNETWIISEAGYKRAKLFLEEKWSRRNIPKLAALSGESVPSDEKYAECPPIITLQETDKFRDDNGNLFDVQMVGTRTEHDCYFKLADVSAAFNMPNLDVTVRHGNYLRVDHYVTFDCTKNYRLKKTTPVANNLSIYLTCRGLLKVLYSSRVGNAEKFQNWCRTTLFKATFGTIEEKVELCEEIMDLPVKTLKTFLCKSATDLPVIYLFKVKNPNSREFFKYGCTADFKRRSDELSRKFREMKLSSELELFSYIDPKYIYQAETSLKDSLLAVGTRVTIENHKDSEFVEFDCDQTKFVREQFRMISVMYAGQTAELQKQMDAIRSEHKLEMAESRRELEAAKHMEEMAVKDNEILQLRIQLLETEMRCLKSGFKSLN